MKKRRWYGVIGLFLLVLLWTFGRTAEAQASSGFNLLSAVSAKTPAKASSGKWKTDKNGRRYIYKDKTYPQNVWLKIAGKYYYFNKKGYVRTGRVKYKGGTYYLSSQSRNKGQLLTGLQTISGKKYYFSPKTGSMVTGWKKLGKNWFYFNSKTGAMAVKTWVGKRYLLSDGKMAVNRWIDGNYVGKDGYIVSRKKAPKKSSNSKARLIILGDCRTEAMQANRVGNAIYIGKVSMGYNWLSSTAGPRLESYLSQYPESTVVFNFGLNDYLYQKNNYLKYYRNFIARHPKADIYIMSINPVIGVGAYNVCNATIKPFNDAMKAAFPEHYLDCYSYLLKAGYYARDGQHYDVKTYKKIYDYIVKTVGWK